MNELFGKLYGARGSDLKKLEVLPIFDAFVVAIRLIFAGCFASPDRPLSAAAAKRIVERTYIRPWKQREHDMMLRNALYKAVTITEEKGPMIPYPEVETFVNTMMTAVINKSFTLEDYKKAEAELVRRNLMHSPT